MWSASLKRDNSLAEVGDALMALPDYYALVGLQAMMEREESYDRAAAASSPSRSPRE